MSDHIQVVKCIWSWKQIGNLMIFWVCFVFELETRYNLIQRFNFIKISNTTHERVCVSTLFNIVKFCNQLQVDGIFTWLFYCYLTNIPILSSVFKHCFSTFEMFRVEITWIIIEIIEKMMKIVENHIIQSEFIPDLGGPVHSGPPLFIDQIVCLK